MPETIQVLIVEDEAIVATDLSEELELNGYGVAGIADNYEDALRLFGSRHVDIVLMDIFIKGDRDGVATAAELTKIKRVPLIYITAFTDAATIERVKHTNPAAFLVKPYDFDNVRVAIDLALHHFAATAMEITPAEAADKQLDKALFFQLDDAFFIKQNYRFIKCNLSEILYAETDHNYVLLHTRSQKFVIRLSLAELLERINYAALVRIHRSYAVNLQEISSFDDQIIKIAQQSLPLGRNYRQTFLDSFNPR